MPSDSMPVPHYPQSSPGACLPACARMVLAALGHSYTEQELAQAMASYSFGTPASRVTRLQKLGHRITYGTSTLSELGNYLVQGYFPIVFVDADFLPWADFTGFHALVLVALTEASVWVMDPSLDNGPTEMTIDAFLLTWEEFDSRLAVIT
jgi:ABC-type bacteriocin/lantibiotic exporter with double-glycine peptidase domain